MRPAALRNSGLAAAGLAALAPAAVAGAVALASAKDETILVSRTSADAKGTSDSAAPAISADGRYIAFESTAQLDSDDGDAISDVYVRDLEMGTTVLVSRATGATGAKGTAASSAPSISADGRYVAFQSDSKLDPTDDGDSSTDVYVRDLQASTTTLASRPTGASGLVVDAASTVPAISADGRYVAFQSSAPLDVADTDAQQPDVYRRDLQTATTELVSRAGGAAGADADNFSQLPSISGDGRLVSFESTADNLTDDADTKRDIFVRDMQAAATILVSRATGAAGVKGNDNSQHSALSADGRYVAFDSQATNLDPDDPVAFTPDVYVRDLQASTTELVSRATGSPGVPGEKANAASVGPALSADGRYVAFESLAYNLNPGDALGTPRGVYVRDRSQDTTALVSRAGGEFGAKGNDASMDAAISATGRFVAYDSLATNLHSDDSDAIRDVYARDVLGPPDTTPPQIATPANITVEATGPSGAVVSYAAPATDNVAVQTSGCVPASGNVFPIGTTTVACTATDTSANTTMATFTVRVADTTPPTIAVPANIAAQATSSAGAVVSYAASADDVVGVASFGCVPASGATFPAGTTTVTCSAADAAGNGAHATFTVAVAPLPVATSPPPPPPPGPGAVVPAPRSAAGLGVRYARIVRGSRVLDVLAPISPRASGRVAVELRSAGRTLRFTVPIDGARARIRFRKRISARQAALGTGVLTISYAGDPDTRPQSVRLRAGSRRAGLRVVRPKLVNGRLRARGTIAAAARGVVRVQLEYVHRGATRRLSFDARIARGRWRLDRRLSPAALAEIGERTGGVDASVLFMGYVPLRIGGEMYPAQVLGPL
ncbi:MAG: hypothetical protein QOJ35_339 [Solirubrobacteraceae bacterium]|nr:hypothetical protein [Solirubrobacteraceae bacterium]